MLQTKDLDVCGRDICGWLHAVIYKNLQEFPTPLVVLIMLNSGILLDFEIW